MGQDSVYWQRIEERQKSSDQIGDSTVARQTSPISVQIPKTGQQVLLERSYLQPDASVTIRLDYVSEKTFTAIEVTVWLLGILAALLVVHAAKRLKAWIEVLFVTAFLVIDVCLDMFSDQLAREFLLAGFAVFAVFGIHRLLRITRRRIGRILGGDVE